MNISYLKYCYKKFIRDFFNPLRYPILEENFNSPTLNEYYLLFDEAVLKSGGSQEFHFDSEGIPVIPIPIDVGEKGMHYYPISIGQYGLAIYHSYLKNPTDINRDRFLKIVTWFSNNQDEKGYWRCSVPEIKFGLKAGWASAMAQGRGINILLRGYQLTKNEEYLRQVNKALETFFVEVKDGGIRGEFNGIATYEEYPAIPSSHVLNGMIFAIFGIYDYCRMFPNDAKIASLFSEGVVSIKKLLPYFDLGYWTAYDLLHLEVSCKKKNIATVHYNSIHVAQMRVLAKITGDQHFEDVAKKWAKYEKNIFGKLRVYFGKFLVIRKRKGW